MSKKRSYLACVTLRYESDYIIRTAGCIAEDDANSRLSVISVLPDSPDLQQLEVMEHLRDTARNTDAPMTILYNQNPVHATVDHIRRHKITHVIAGMPEDEGDFISLLRSVLPKVNIILIPNSLPVTSDTSVSAAP